MMYSFELVTELTDHDHLHFAMFSLRHRLNVIFLSKKMQLDVYSEPYLSQQKPLAYVL